MTDLNTAIRRRQLQPIKQDDLNATNVPTDGQIVQINMPTGDFTFIDAPTGGAGGGSTYLTTFTNSDLGSAGVITIAHNLGSEYPVVFVFDDSDEWIIPTFIKSVDSNTVTLDFAGMTPLSGTYRVRVNGATGATGAFLQSFVNSDLSSAGVLSITHSLGQRINIVQISDNNGLIISPDDIDLVDTNNLTVDLSTFAPLSGTWDIIVSTGGAGGGTGDSIQDADNDTKVEVEKNADEDIIRFTSLAVQRAQIDVNGLKLSTGADVNEFSIDGTLAGNSDDAVPTEKAVKTYIDGEVTPLVSDVSKNETNIVLNAFRIAVNGSLTQFNMVDGIVDEYEDESGVRHIPTPFSHMALEDNADDGTGANAVTNIGTPTYTSGKLNNALTLNGVDQALNVDALKTDILSDTTGSISFWVYPTDITTSVRIFSLNDASSDPHQGYVGISGGYLRMVIEETSGSKWFILQNPITINVWQHYVIVQDGVTPKVYRNGIDVTAGITLTGFTGGEWFTDLTGIDSGRLGCGISNNNPNSNFLSGQIDDFRYYQNKALTSDEVSLLYNSGTGTEDSEIGSQKISYNSTDDYYSPSKDSLTTSPFSHMLLSDNTDVGTGANAVTNIGTPTYTSGKIGNALTLDGSTDALNLDALRTDIATNTTGTFSMWINPSAASDEYIFSFGDTNVTEFVSCSLFSTTGKVIVGCDIATVNQFSGVGNTVLTTDGSTWYHIVVTQNGTQPQIYINGVAETMTWISTDTDRTTWFNDATNIDNGRLGCINTSNTGNNFFFNGKIDDFRYYPNKVLTQAEIDLLYNSGAGTEADQPDGDADNMTLISDTFTAEAQPDIGRIVLFTEDIDTVTLNTDLILKISRNAGTTYSTATLINEGEYESGKNIITASVDISGQPSGTSLKYKIETANNKDLRAHGVGLSWD